MIIVGSIGITLVTIMALEAKGKINVNPWLLKFIMYTVFLGGVGYCFWVVGSTFFLF